MAQSLKGRSLLTLSDYTAEEIRLLLDTAREYRRLKYAGIPHRIHEGKNVALLFEKASTRTRCAFTVAANDLELRRNTSVKMIFNWVRKRRLKIPLRFWVECLTELNSADLITRLLRSWRVTLAFQCGMD